MTCVSNGESFSDHDEALDAILREISPYTHEDIDPYEERGRVERVLTLVEETGVPVGYFVRKLDEIPSSRRFFQEVLENLAEFADLATDTKSRRSIHGLVTQASWLQRIAFLVPQNSPGLDKPKDPMPPMPLPYDSGADMIPDIEKDIHLTQEWKHALVSVIHTLEPQD